MNEATPFRRVSFWRRLSGLGPAYVFVCVALPVGVLLVIVTPPFQVPDEPNHFARAFQVSDGQVVSQRTTGSVGGLLPRSITLVANDVIGRVPFNPDVKQDLGAWDRALDVPLRSHDRIETAFPNTALSGPVAYLPQALGIQIGRGLGLSTLMVFYWGRLISLLACVALTALAIRWVPVRPWTCVLLSLLPMSLFVRSSLSSDGPTLALTLLALAICLRPSVASSEGRVSDSHAPVDTRQRWLLVSVAALLAIGKPPYGAVSFLALATPPRSVGGMKRYVAMMLALTAVFVVAQGGWALAMRGKAAVMSPGADPQTQLENVAGHPAETAAFLVWDLIQRAPALAHQAAGVLGWLDARVPAAVIVLLGLILVLVALGEPGLPPGRAGFRWLGAAIFALGTFTLLAMNYVWWTPPGAPHVEGIQGRHFLPLLPFLFISFNPPGWIAGPLSRMRPALVVAFVVTSAPATLLTVVNRYYLDV